MILSSSSAPIADLDGRIVDLEILCRTANAKTLVQKLQELTPTFAPAAAHRVSLMQHQPS